MTDLANLDQALREILIQEWSRDGVEGEGYLAALRSGDAEGTRAFKSSLEAMHRAYALAESKEMLGKMVGEPVAKATLKK